MARLQDDEGVGRDIAVCREAGADFFRRAAAPGVALRCRYWLIMAFEPPTQEDVRDIEKCRAHVIHLVGADAALIEVPPPMK